MPINRLDSKPPVSSTDRTADSGSITTDTNFQGRNVSVAKEQQSENFLPAGEARLSAHIFSTPNKYISVRNITTAPETDDYEEVGSPMHDYEEVRSPSDDYEKMSLPAHDYEEVSSPSGDYEEMSPSTDYVNVAPSAKEYEDINLPPQNLYREMRSVEDSPKTSRARLNRSELIRMKQLSDESGDYMKEVTNDLQKMTSCMRNLSTLSKDEMLAFRDYVIPQHINCADDYSKAIQTLLKSRKHKPKQQKYLQETNQQLIAIRSKLIEAQGVLGEAVQNENFSTETTANYVDLSAEKESPASRLMKIQSQVLDIHRVAADIKYRVNYLGGSSLPTSRKRGKEELEEIAACRNDLISLKTGLSQCLSEIKQAMDTINDYEARIREQPPAVGEQRTLRERRYTMHLANRLESRIKNINGSISDSWDKLKKMS